MSQLVMRKVANEQSLAMIAALVVFGFFLRFWSWCHSTDGLRIESKHSSNGRAFAEVFLWGGDPEWSLGLEMETEGSCPFPILWPPTQIERGLIYEIPLAAPCLRNQFNWTIQDPTGFHKKLRTILEPKRKTELERSHLIPEHVSDVRQARSHTLRWTRSPCADRYVVHVNGNQRQQLNTKNNWINLTFDICEEVL